MIFLFLFLTASLFGQTYFLSDGLGLQSSPAMSLKDSEWILEIKETEGLTQRILYKDQSEYKRWDRKQVPDRGENLSNEKYYYKNSLRTETILKNDKVIVEETSFDSAGIFLSRKEYHYNEQNRLESITTFDQEGNITDENGLLYRFNNSLRGIDISSGGRIRWRTGNFDRRYLDTLYIKEDSTESIYNFEGNDIVFSKTKKNDSDDEEVSYEYNSRHELIKELRKNIPENTRTEIIYNEEGDILTRISYKDDTLESTETNSYLGTKLAGTVLKRKGLKLEWVYEYRDDETDSYKTTFYRNGIIERQTEITDEGKIEILYRKGVEILRRIIEEEES